MNCEGHSLQGRYVFWVFVCIRGLLQSISYYYIRLKKIIGGSLVILAVDIKFAKTSVSMFCHRAPYYISEGIVPFPKRFC